MTGELTQPAALAVDTAAPQIAQLNVSHNSRLHVGPQFVSVTQNVHHDRVVKEGAWRVFVAWARGTSRGERLACAGALLALVMCAVAAAVLATRRTPEEPDVAPHAWNITRRMWLSAPRDPEEAPWSPHFLPLRMVIVQHTAGAECHRFADCAAVMRNLQEYYHHNLGYDLPYNYLVGNDARIYEGRGSAVIGAHTYRYNRCSLGLAFIGNYESPDGTVVTREQSERARAFLDALIAEGLLHERVLVLAALDVQNTASPGKRLYADLRSWPNAPPNPKHYGFRVCEDIYEELEKQDHEINATSTTEEAV